MTKQAVTDWRQHPSLVDARAELDRLEAEAVELEAKKQQPSGLEQNQAAREQAAATIREIEQQARIEAGKITEAKYKDAIRKMIDAMTEASKANGAVASLCRELAVTKGGCVRNFSWDDLRPPKPGLGDMQSRLSMWLKAAKEYCDV